MRPAFVAAAIIAATVLAATAVSAGERYGSRPPVTLSPNLAAAWTIDNNGQRVVRQQRVRQGVVARQKPRNSLFGEILQRRQPQRAAVQRNYQPRRGQPQLRSLPRPQAVSVQRPAKPKPRGMDPIYLPKEVAYSGSEKPGTIVIDTTDRFLYLVQAGGTAKRYGVGVAKPGFEWAGSHKITRKAHWPSWTPPKEMIAREAKKGHYLPARMEGGPENPLGARALYLGSTLYRIHGTNAPWTIGQNVSSGCIRMRNEDVIDLYGRVNVGTRVVVR